MFSRVSIWVMALLTALAVICVWRCVDVFAGQIKTGDKVTVADRAALMQGDEQVLTVEAGTKLQATAVNGDWVAVETKKSGESVSGWINAKHLDLASRTSASSEREAIAARRPRELAMQSLPAYRIEPPDVIQVEVLKLVPLPPYHIENYDVLQIKSIGTSPDQPLNDHYIVDEGKINLGPGYGWVSVAGMTLDEATAAIRVHLKQILQAPEVSVQLARASGLQPVTGSYLVGPDGTINLRQYGVVHLAGKTIAEAKALLEKHLVQYFDPPEVSLEVTGYNSKFCYVITESTKMGDNVARVPITGNDTVLDVISHIGGLSKLSSRKIWVARPTPPEFGKDIVLPVDWEAITRRGSTATNYQVFPSDRVFIAERSEVAPNDSPSNSVKGGTTNE